MSPITSNHNRCGASDWLSGVTSGFSLPFGSRVDACGCCCDVLRLPSDYLLTDVQYVEIVNVFNILLNCVHMFIL